MFHGLRYSSSDKCYLLTYGTSVAVNKADFLDWKHCRLKTWTRICTHWTWLRLLHPVWVSVCCINLPKRRSHFMRMCWAYPFIRISIDLMEAIRMKAERRLYRPIWTSNARWRKFLVKIGSDRVRHFSYRFPTCTVFPLDDENAGRQIPVQMSRLQKGVAVINSVLTGLRRMQAMPKFGRERWHQ